MSIGLRIAIGAAVLVILAASARVWLRDLGRSVPLAAELAAAPAGDGPDMPGGCC